MVEAERSSWVEISSNAVFIRLNNAHSHEIVHNRVDIPPFSSVIFLFARIHGGQDRWALRRDLQIGMQENIAVGAGRFFAGAAHPL